MKYRRRLITSVAFSMTALTSFLPSAGAQEAETAETESRQATITVTAQKREQSLQDVAGSLVAFDTSKIQERGLDSVENLVLATPGVVYQETNGSSQISVRGVGLLVNTGVAEPAVGTHIDGIFQPRASVSAIQFLDLERIEVLRGPQGTLYGRNTTGGSINFISAKPKESFEGFASAGFGSYNEKTVKGYVTGPIAGDKVLGRLSGVYGDRDGYYDNITTGSEPHSRTDWGVRGALRFLPASDLTIDLSGFHQEEKGDYPLQHPLTGANPFVDQLIGFGILPPGSVTIPTEPWETANETEPSTRVETSAATLDINWTLGNGIQAKSLTGYTDHQLGPQIFDADGTSFGIVNIGGVGNPRIGTSKAFSQEFNLSGESFDDRLNWFLGLYYFDEDHKHSIPSLFPSPIVQGILGAGFAPIFGVGTRFTDLQQRIDEETTSQAVFADLTYSVTDTLRIGLGARYTDDTKDIGQTLIANVIAGAGGPVPQGTPVSLALCTDQRSKLSFSDTNYKVRAEWDASEDAMLYGQWQNGFKDGGINLGVCGDEFDPEEIEATEIGAKTSWMNGALVFNFSLFHYDYSNLQTLAFRNLSDSFIDNIPKAKIQGAELELSARPTDRLGLDVGIALLDAEIEEFQSFDTAYPAAGIQDLSGKSLPSSPKYTVLAGLDYDLETGLGPLTLRGEVFTSDSYNFRVFENPEDEQDSYTLLNLYATYNSPSDTYSVRAFVKNATDEDYYKFLLFSPLTGPAGEYAAPRTWGVELGYRF